MRKWLSLLLAAAFLSAITVAGFAASKQSSRGILYANIETNQGTIVAKLYEKEAPVAVKNFTGLATGTKAFTDPKTGKQVKRPYYNGLWFHRVIPGFMIQGGCPLSRDPQRAGTGGPGYTIPDEIVPSLHYDKPGRLAMARTSMPNTGGSQFFITVAPTPQLDGGYTIFGQVVKGQNVANKISQTPRTASDRPLKPMVIKQITIYRAKSPK